MTKRIMRWLAAILAACILTATFPAALMEEADSVSDPIEQAAEDGEALELMPEEVPEEEPAGDADAAEAAGAVEAAEQGRYYARAIHSETEIYRDSALTEALYTLSQGDAVLVTGIDDSIAQVAFTALGRIVTGYAPAGAFPALTDEEAEALQNELAESAVLLYEDDINWPVPRVFMGSVAKAKDFTAISNDQEYVVQGKTITARMVGDHSDCWSWARALYYMIWGVKFTTDWQGTDETGRNLIRNLTDEERLLTGDNLRKFIGQSALGCTLRICSCPSTCSNFSKDGCSKHEKHSLIVVDKDADGMVVMDNMTGNGHDKFATRYYTWDKFASHWAKYKMVKYIKWPYAPEYKKSGNSGTTASTPAPAVKPTGVALDRTGTVTVGLGDTLKLKATLTPSGATADLTWKTSNAKIATVDASGAVTPVKAGSCTIGVFTDNDLSATVKVTVVAPSKVKLNKSGTVNMSAGETLTLLAAVSPAEASQSVLWASSNEGVATVRDGVVTAVGAGTATIGVKTVAGNKTASVKVKVTDPAAPTKVKLNKSGTVELQKGKTLTLTATLSPSNARTTLTWGSSDESVATVRDGVVTAVGAGTATVGVKTANGKTASVKVKVTDPVAVTKVKLNKSGTVTLKKGKTLKLSATLRPSGAKSQLTWRSSDTSVATVSDSGVVTAVGTGTATVGAIAENGKYATVKIKVK